MLPNNGANSWSNRSIPVNEHSIDVSQGRYIFISKIVSVFIMNNIFFTLFHFLLTSCRNIYLQLVAMDFTVGNGIPIWKVALAIHICGWLLQFIGHGVFEGKVANAVKLL